MIKDQISGNKKSAEDLGRQLAARILKKDFTCQILDKAKRA
ncbi:MAG: hypothetical protein ABII74_05070 [Elusimicrobiota bacterium]